METYSHQRKCRLADIILDYLDDDEVSARRFYEELLSEVDELAEYHKNKYEKTMEFKELILGHRFIDSFELSP